MNLLAVESSLICGDCEKQTARPVVDGWAGTELTYPHTL